LRQGELLLRSPEALRSGLCLPEALRPGLRLPETLRSGLRLPEALRPGLRLVRPGLRAAHPSHSLQGLLRGPSSLRPGLRLRHLREGLPPDPDSRSHRLHGEQVVHLPPLQSV
jgi:hypothetical protein